MTMSWVGKKNGCQPSGVGKGPFKGKGEAILLWHRESQDRLAQIHRDMAALRDETKAVPDRQFSVDLHCLRHRDAKSLRWRMNSGAHMTWPRIVLLLARLPPSMVQWYWEVQARLLVINGQEQVARYEVKTAQRLIEDMRSLLQRESV